MTNKQIHSLLFVPCVDRKMQKALSFDADAFIFDLEDSIKPESKEQALRGLIDYLNTTNTRGHTIYVRLNEDRIEYELCELRSVSDCISGFIIPKAEDTHMFRFNELKGKDIIPLLETPMGIINLKNIVECSNVSAIAFGAEDYCSETGMLNNEKYLLPIKTEIVKYAKAYKKTCYDTISKELTQTEKLKKEVMISKNIGFDGKLAIHPNQIALINTIFSYKNKKVICKIIEAFEQSSEGVVVYDGVVYETPHIEKFKKEIAE